MSGNSENILWVYGQEQGCDVIFKVGPDEPWRLPAHSSVLKKANQVFQMMLSDNYVLVFPHTETVPDVDGRAFDNLLRFLYNEPVSLQCVENALQTLCASHKYRCSKLVRVCVDFLKNKLNETNVLRILRWAQLLTCDYCNQKTQEDIPLDLTKCLGDLPIPSAPPMLELETTSEVNENETESQLILPENLDNIEADCRSLLQDCLSLVDKIAVLILASDEFEDLDKATVQLILSRDTLDVPNEFIVFNALLRWADNECKRKQLPLTSVSKRLVLKDSLFLPRYLAMNLSSFQSGPVKSDLFTQSEIQLLTKFIKINNGSQYWAPLLMDFPSLRPYLHDGSRRPIRPGVPVIQPLGPKRKSFRILKLFRSNKFCCRKVETVSPVSSNNSSPTHQTNASRRESQSGRFSRFNLIEGIFICLACLFD